MDNFYTRHVLAEKLKQMTDGEARIVGTCKMNLVNKVNAVGVKKAIELLADQPHGSWALVRAYNNEPENASIGDKRQRGSRRACRAHLRAHESHQNIIMTWWIIYLLESIKRIDLSHYKISSLTYVHFYTGRTSEASFCWRFMWHMLTHTHCLSCFLDQTTPHTSFTPCDWWSWADALSLLSVACAKRKLLEKCIFLCHIPHCFINTDD